MVVRLRPPRYRGRHRLGAPARRATPGLVVGVVTLVVAGTVLAGPAQAATVTRQSALAAAAAYGPKHGYTTGIAVYDTVTGQIYGHHSFDTFASESVVKAMIATRLLLQGRMHGSTASRAYTMITRSDDAIASAFYGSVGGDGLISWIKKHYAIPFLGSGPRRAGWWGNTHITAAGMVTFYAKVEKDPKVGPWLRNAMHHAHDRGSDGFYQAFGLRQADRSAAIKQGWGFDYDDWSRSADMNTTGYVGAGDRYAVAILARGKPGTYGSRMGGLLTTVAKLLLPGGTFPAPAPRITSTSVTRGSTAGGQTVSIRGTDLTGVTAVYFGSARGTAVRSTSPAGLTVRTPAHAAGTVDVRVVSNHGTSTARRFTFGPAPLVTGLSSTGGATAGGATVTITGTGLAAPTTVYFGATHAQVVSAGATSLQVIAPAHAAGSVDVRVRTAYGLSPVARPAAGYAYAADTPTLSPASGPSNGGTVVTVTGDGFDQATGVTVDGTPVAADITSPSTLTFVAPAHTPGVASVQVTTATGTRRVQFTYAG